MIDQEQAYRDLVSLEAKGKAPEGTRERLAADPERWRNALQKIRMEIAAQTAEREATLEEFRLVCRRQPDGRELFAGRRSEFMRWKASTKRFRASLETRLAEVAQLAKQNRTQVFVTDAMVEWKTNVRDLLEIVGEMLATPEDQVIPDTLWQELETAYAALPEWMHHAEKYRTQELTAAD